MATLGLRRDERIGLLAAVALHAAVLGALYLDPHSDQVVEPPQRIEVTISDDVGLTSTAPNPYSQAAAAVAPTIGEEPPVPEPEPVSSPLPPEPAPRVIEPARPKPQPKKAPPKETPSTRKKSAIDDIVSKPAEKTGGSRIGSDFLKGVQGAQSTQGKGTPAASIGPQVRSALSAAITRKLKPYWQAPQGPEAEELVTYLTFDLNKDGSLNGRPSVVRQAGITDVNRNQAPRHAEQAVRAVQLAAPFDLPAEYYDAWKHVSSFKFDKRLSQ